MILQLFNGATTKQAWNPDSPHFIDSWKPESMEVECDSVTVKFGTHITAEIGDEANDYYISDDGLIEHDGVFYGSFAISNKKDGE
jgi:hypothetical protein